MRMSRTTPAISAAVVIAFRRNTAAREVADATSDTDRTIYNSTVLDIV